MSKRVFQILVRLLEPKLLNVSHVLSQFVLEQVEIEQSQEPTQ